jgi:hypothetical protein
LTRNQDRICIDIRWQTHACTTLTAPRSERNYERWRTAPTVIEQIRGLAARHTDAKSATELNVRGWKPGNSGAFTARKVRWVRRAYGIASACPLKTDTCRTVNAGMGATASRRLPRCSTRTCLYPRQVVPIRAVAERPGDTSWSSLDHPDTRNHYPTQSATALR